MDNRLKYSSRFINNKLNYLFDPKHKYLKYPFKDYISYITPYLITNIISNEIYNILLLENNNTYKYTLWDMFAGIGQDSIIFSNKFSHILSTEVNLETFQCLKENIVECKKENIEIFNKSCIDLGLNIGVEIDIFYMDPPWNGSLYLEDIILENNIKFIDMLDNIMKLQNKKIIIKMSYKCKYIENKYSNNIIGIFGFPTKLKFIILNTNI